MATAGVQHEQGISPSAMVGSDGGRDGEVVCLDEYLTTPYSPDCEYVDGHLELRNLANSTITGFKSESFFCLLNMKKNGKSKLFRNSVSRFQPPTTAYPM